MTYFLGLFLAINCFAHDWNDLEIGNSYSIKQALDLPQTERSHSSLHIAKNEKVVLSEIRNHSTLKQYAFKYQNCPGPQMSTDMEIISVQETLPLVEVGVQLKEKCLLKILISNKDIRSESFFE